MPDQPFRYLPDDPRGLSAELQDAPFVCVPTHQSAMSPDGMRVLAWLRGHKTQIVAAERRYNVDRRAIAGAIAWEALRNPHPAFSLWPGPGKVHSVAYYSGTKIPAVIGGPPGAAESAEQMGYLPEHNLFGRVRVLKTTIGSIYYIAAIMRMGADQAEDRGYIIADNPRLLTEFYQAWLPGKWSAHLAGKPRGSPLVAADKMAIWVGSHLDYLQEGVGKPQVQPVSLDTRFQKQW